MTLKDYTDYVTKFVLAAYNITPAFATRQEKEQFQALLKELASLIGPENWEKLVDVFMEKVDFPEGFDKCAHAPRYILWDRIKFIETLAKFCEPLLIKSKKEKGT